MIGEKYRTILVLAILALIGIIALLFHTEKGIGISPDSTLYIDSVRNYLAGRGLSIISYTDGEIKPIIRFLPLFPAVLTIIGSFGIDPLVGARWLNIFLFGSNILLVGFIINRYTRSIWTSIFGSFLLLTSRDMLYIHSMAWTEPLFIFFGLLGLFLLALYIEKQKLFLLFASAGAIALAFLDRYAGLPLVITGIVGIFFFSKENYAKKILACSYFVVISCFPIISWFIRNLYTVGHIIGYKVIFHHINMTHIRIGINTISLWLLPKGIQIIPRGIFFLIMVTIFSASGIILNMKQKKNNLIKQHLWSLPKILATFILIYIVLLAILISFVAINIYPDYRFLSPVYVSGLVLVLCVIYDLLHLKKLRRAVKITCIILCAIFAWFYLLRGINNIVYAYNKGMQYSSERWKRSEIIEKIRLLPAGIQIYTNEPEPIYFLTSRPARTVPFKVDPATWMPNSNYLSQLTSVRKELKSYDAVLVCLHIEPWRGYLPSEKELREKLKLHPFIKAKDGMIYKVER